MSTKKNAIVKVNKTVPAIQKRNKHIIVADNKVDQAMGALKQFQSLLDFANKGGRGACWGILTSAVSLGIGLAIHAVALNYFGTIGMMVGLGIFGSRILHRIKDADLAKLDERLRDLKVMFAKGTISKELYDLAYKKAIRDAKLV